MFLAATQNQQSNSYVFPGNHLVEPDLLKDPISSLFAIMLIGASKERGVKLNKVLGYFKPDFLQYLNPLLHTLPTPVVRWGQGVHRSVTGDSRSDLAFLDYAITSVSIIYPITKSENLSTMRHFWQLTKIGMESMAFTYGELKQNESDPVSFKRWEQKINDILSSAVDQEHVENNKNLIDMDSISSALKQEHIEQTENKDLIDKVKVLWTLSQIEKFNKELELIAKEEKNSVKAAMIELFDNKIEKQALGFVQLIISRSSFIKVNLNEV
jgi:hypothetical protein